VVAGVITPQNSPTASASPLGLETSVLLSQRLEGKHLAGCWEFPGGKVDADESDADALARELSEELGIVVHRCEPWTTLTHHYPEKTVVLKIRRVLEWSGVPSGKEGQNIQWVPWALVPERPMPAADRSLLKVFGMSPFSMMVPPREAADGPSNQIDWLLERLAWIDRTKWAASPWWFYWSLHDRPWKDAEIECVSKAIDLAKADGHVVMIKGPIALAEQLGADGIHLDVADAKHCKQRPVGWKWVSMACHDEQSLLHAGRMGADFVTLSPLRKTPSHPGQSGLGGEQFQTLIRHAPVPVMALGGLGLEDLDWVRSLGGFGVASLKGFHNG